jgi:hypothetical protein
MSGKTIPPYNILEQLELGEVRLVPIYIGTDETSSQPILNSGIEL